MNKTATFLLLLCTTIFAQQKGTFTDTRDGKTYKTTKIGEQVLHLAPILIHNPDLYIDMFLYIVYY